MFGIVPQLPLSAEEPEVLVADELGVLDALDELGAVVGVEELDELDELDEHAVAAASSNAPPRPSVSRTVLCLMRFSL